MDYVDKKSLIDYIDSRINELDEEWHTSDFKKRNCNSIRVAEMQRLLNDIDFIGCKE